ncbi:DUF619-domain-containing protein [Gonapodya prolifera JEL478]|uniref:Amino-acid acetyltransferase, mitochondrial n=1 Tax=Gonapodya prolifera (strain JEL478) TaxID=1344416 RepID=A0A139AFU7_GONPJ|nr:DUF619-domain-containing protein [Gonapodya prolifera JEL478]|eukprot:KXS15295.1 DUF619-domain-containing protein [Gonapodya prolifera JEL478]
MIIPPTPTRGVSKFSVSSLIQTQFVSRWLRQTLGAGRGDVCGFRLFSHSQHKHVLQSPATETVSEDSVDDDGNAGMQVQSVVKDRDFYVKLLSSAPSPREARSFLKKFSSSLPPPKTRLATGSTSKQGISTHHPLLDAPDRIDNLALVLVETGLPRSELESFATTLVYLQKLGLTTIVVLNEAAHSTDRIGQTYHRSTGKEYRDRALHEAFRVANVLDRSGGRGMPIYDGVFQLNEPHFTPDASLIQVASLESGTSPVTASLSTIHTALRLHQTPILTSLATTTSHHVPLSSSISVSALAQALVADTRLADPARLIIVNSRGGVRTQAGPLSLVSLEEDYEDIVEEFARRARAVTPADNSGNIPTFLPGPGLEDEDELLDPTQLRDLQLCKTVLSQLPPTSSAIIAAASASPTLLYNILTDRPLFSSSLPPPSNNLVISDLELTPSEAPTVVRTGVKVTTHTSLDTLDLPRLKELLEASFGKTLAADPFWDRLRSCMDCTLLAGDYMGASIMTREPWPADEPVPRGEEMDVISGKHPGVVYLDKFAAHPKAQGSGVADALWRRMDRMYGDWLWRSRADNPVNKWYFDRSDGNFRLPGTHWMVFWHGARGIPRMRAYAEVCRDIPASFGPSK